MSNRKFYLGTTVTTAILVFSLSVTADVEHRQVNSMTAITYVSDDNWQPKDFVNGTTVPAAWLQTPMITIDGNDDEAAWSKAVEIEVPLNYGNVKRAWLKALYTDDDVFIRVRWADSSEDRQHHPWTWNPEQQRYVAGPQIEDSVMLSFEAGCEWTPSLLGGHVYDFDAWHWLAARSDPMGQALDLYGNVRSRDPNLSDFEVFPSRVVEQDLVLKFTENQNPELNADWSQLDRVYIEEPIVTKLWIRAVPDGMKHAPDYVEQLAAPTAEPADISETYPQFSPVKLTGEAAEVAARGLWKDGYWTVEFRRARFTPVAHIYDTIFNRLVQFSVHVFDQAEQLDQASESDRLFLQFLPEKQPLVKD
jgi:hypothetical protein